MKRRHVHRWAIWLLPLLLLRAFVPAGFMLTADASGLSLVICSITTPLPAPDASDHSAHHHHEHGQQEAASQGSQQHEQSALCPFAVAGVACSHEIAPLAGAIDAPAYELPPDSLPLSSAGPRRADRIRGPPFLA